MNQRKLGSYYEALAAKYLQNIGYEILERNYRCRYGEVDLIAKDGDYLVFVEVKFRQSPSQGGSLAAVTRKKQQTLSKVAAFYLSSQWNRMDLSCRFDVVGFDGAQITLIQNAFEAVQNYF